MSDSEPQNGIEQPCCHEDCALRAKRQIVELERRLDAGHTRFLEVQSQLHAANVQHRHKDRRIAELEDLVGELTDRLSRVETRRTIIVTGGAVAAMDPRD